MKIDMKDNLLLEFIGRIDRIKSVFMYTWGASDSVPVVVNLLTDNINKNRNIVSSDSITIEAEKLQPLSINKYKKSYIKKNINGLYSNGDKFTLNGKSYVGVYHYLVNEKIYKTGSVESEESVQLNYSRKNVRFSHGLR